ncbi:hypothetical protein [Arthrobacter bussei]|uniref:Uncharacterized protein n=1 Tax=Arthrobacter bussei TaxID=2594179 RepID=A0A7X1TPZ3_9MICC|nr:hypothetical protein [Arthrobacter bussei]MPY12101.1 hypothetical protein [Arthrobacter bussei]
MVAHGRELLQLLVNSKMAKPEDKQMLDDIWAKPQTHMEPADIEHLFRNLAERDLTEDQRSLVEDVMDDSPTPEGNRPTKEER